MMTVTENQMAHLIAIANDISCQNHADRNFLNQDNLKISRTCVRSFGWYERVSA